MYPAYLVIGGNCFNLLQLEELVSEEQPVGLSLLVDLYIKHLFNIFIYNSFAFSTMNAVPNTAYT